MIGGGNHGYCPQLLVISFSFGSSIFSIQTGIFSIPNIYFLVLKKVLEEIIMKMQELINLKRKERIDMLMKS